MLSLHAYFVSLIIAMVELRVLALCSVSKSTCVLVLQESGSSVLTNPSKHVCVVYCES